MEEQISNENKKTEITNVDFLDCLLNDIDIMSILKESLSNQKTFISFITKQLKKLKESISKNQINKYSKMKSEKIFLFLANNSEALGLSFFSLLIEEKEFSKDIIFGFFYDDIFKEKINLLVQKIVEIFNFDFEEKEIQNPMDDYIKDLIDYGIIQKNELKEKRQSLTEEEQLFVQIESIFFAIKTYRKLGNDVEKDADGFFNSEISSCEQNLELLKLNGDDISNASYEYYLDKIQNVKKFKENKQDNKIENVEEKKMDVSDSSEEEEEEEEINTPKKIIEEIKELRKLPLKERIYFYKEEQLIQDEDEYTEFKNYYFPLGKTQKDELKRQFCSFINSNGGRLYIGINDLRVIKGVVTNEKVTRYEEKIKDLIRGFSPPIDGNEFIKFYAIPIKNNQNGKIIDNLFVFKIIIKKGDPYKLYSISSKEFISSIRIQGQSVNLTAEEIHKEIIERKKKKIELKDNNKLEEEFDMSDPAPFISQKIINNEEMKAKSKIIKNNNITIKCENNKKDIKEDKKEKIDKDKEEDWNMNMNNKTKKKKKKKKNKNGIIRVEISNIDKSVDIEELKSSFKGFKYEKLKLFKQQNGTSNGYIDFIKEEDSNNFMETYKDVSFEGRKMKLSILSFNI